MKKQPKRKFVKRRSKSALNAPASTMLANGREQRPTPITVSVMFPVMMETHDRKKFQREGHTIPTLREEDAEGNPIFTHERKWGSTVHVLYLPVIQRLVPEPENGMSRERDLTWADLGVIPGRDRPEQKAYVLRVLSDSIEDAEKKFRAQLPELLTGLWMAQHARANSIAKFEQVVREHANMRNFLAKTDYAGLLDAIMGGTHK